MSNNINATMLQYTLVNVLNDALKNAPQVRQLFEEQIEVGDALAGTGIGVRETPTGNYVTMTGILNAVLTKLNVPVIYKTYYSKDKEQDPFDPNNPESFQKYEMAFTTATSEVTPLAGSMVVAVFPGICTKEDVESLGVTYVFSPLPKEEQDMDVAQWLQYENTLFVIECGLDRLRRLQESGIVFNTIYPNRTFKDKVFENLRSRNTPRLCDYVEGQFDNLMHAFETSKSMRSELVTNFDIIQALKTTLDSKRYINA